MTKDEALAMDLALAALEVEQTEVAMFNLVPKPHITKAITAIKQARSAPVQNRSALTLDRPMTFGGCPFCGSQSCVAGQCRSATRPAAPVQEPVALKPEDVIVETYAIQRGGFMLKPANGVRLIHKPTGTVVQCDSERNQHRNRDTAWRDLEKHLAETTPPAQPAPVQEPYGQVTVVKRPGCVDQHWFYRWPDQPYLDNAAECHVVYTTPPAQPAPVQDHWLSEIADELDDPTLTSFSQVATGIRDLKERLSTPPAAPVQDAEGENKAVRSFLMLYGQPGLTVGQMKKHMAMSGFKSWPAWVDAEPDGAHLTKAGAQLWIRHLFALEATPPAAQRQWTGLTDEDKRLFSSWLDDKEDDEVFVAIEAKLKEKNT